MISELEDSARRLDQQLVAFERLHTDELKRFQDQLETYRRLQNDELQMLRDEVKQLKDELARLRAQGPVPAAPPTVPHIPSGRVALTITRRDFITGNLRSPDHDRGAREE